MSVIIPVLISGLNRKQISIQAPIENELLQIISHQILKDIPDNIRKASFFTLMADECTDSANQEQLVICFQHVDNNYSFDVHEDFIGLFKLNYQ